MNGAGSALIVAALACASAHASQQLALDKGCYNCHGDPPKKNLPTFAELALRYQKVRGDAKAQQQLAAELRKGSIFNHVTVHERLDPETAELFVRWIAEGAR